MLISALLSLALSAAPADTVPAVDLRAEYPRLFRIDEVKEGDDTGYSLVMDTLPTGHVLAPLVNRNRRYFDYLAEHATTPELTQLIARQKWQIGPLRAAYDSLLRSDGGYNAILAASVGRYLAARGTAVAGYDPTRPAPVLAMDDVVQVAARFFYPDMIRPDGTIQTHVCVDLNGVHDLQRPRDLALEAFLYDAIFEAISGGGTPLATEFRRIAAEMNRADLSSDPTVRITRAQGFMWSRLAPSRVLRQTIREAYDRRREFLPFTLAPDPPATD